MTEKECIEHLKLTESMPPPEKIGKIWDLTQIANYSKIDATTAYSWRKRKDFPKPLEGIHGIRYRVKDIKAWAKSKQITGI